MTSLLSAAQLVKPEWLSELLALTILDPRESTRALEHTFALPPESKFRPGFAAALPPKFKTFKTWEPNEARLNMLKGYRFVFVGEKGLEIPAGYRDLVKRGGAEYEAFTLSAGVVRWRKTLLRAKSLAEEKNGKVSPVADADAMELAVGAEEWKEIVSVAKRCAGRTHRSDVELMILSIAWTWSLSNPRTFCKLWRLSTRSSWTRHPQTPRAKVRRFLAIVTPLLKCLDSFTRNASSRCGA
jgi:hypothetical protein